MRQGPEFTDVTRKKSSLKLTEYFLANSNKLSSLFSTPHPATSSLSSRSPAFDAYMFHYFSNEIILPFWPFVRRRKIVGFLIHGTIPRRSLLKPMGNWEN